MRLFYFCWYLCSCFFMIFTNLRQKNVSLNSEFHYNQFVLLHKLIIYNNGTRIIWYYLITQQINFYDWVFHILDDNSMFKIGLWVITFKWMQSGDLTLLIKLLLRQRIFWWWFMMYNCNFREHICFPTCVVLCVPLILNKNNKNKGRDINYFD